MRGRYWERWRAAARRSQIPSVDSSDRTYVGPLYDGYHCWEAETSEKEIFETLAPKIKHHLDSCCDSIPSSDFVGFSLYLVGKSQTTAGPTILFYCMDVLQAKKIRLAIKNSGMLKKYQSLKTAHCDRDPGVENLAQMGESKHKAETPGPTLRGRATVYYDASRPIQSTGMQIFVQHGDDEESFLKSATANIWRHKDKLFYFTAFHLFLNAPTPLNGLHPYVDNANDDLFGIDGDSSEEDEELHIAVTSIASRSSNSLSDSGISDYNVSGSSLSPNPSENSVPSPGNVRSLLRRTVHSAGPIETTSQCAATQADDRLEIAFENSSDPDELTRLGYLHSGSLDKDWALVEITNPYVLSTIDGTRKSSFLDSATVFERPRDANITGITGSGLQIEGRLSGTLAYHRIPYSRSFQEVYRVRITSPLLDGVCGTMIRDSMTSEPFGHIISGCERSGIAYIVPTSHAIEGIIASLENADLSHAQCILDFRRSSLISQASIASGRVDLAPPVDITHVQQSHQTKWEATTLIPSDQETILDEKDEQDISVDSVGLPALELHDDKNPVKLSLAAQRLAPRNMLPNFVTTSAYNSKRTTNPKPQERDNMRKLFRRVKTVLKRGKSKLNGDSSLDADIQIATGSKPSSGPAPIVTCPTVAEITESTMGIEVAVSPVKQQLQHLRVPSQRERARALFERYGLEFDEDEWGHVLPSTEVQMVEKRVRARVHRVCHRCGTMIDTTRVCPRCEHLQCRKCTRYPAKRKPTAKENEMDNSEQAETSGNIKRVSVSRPKVQRIHRWCHKCDTEFSTPGLTECTECGHIRCTKCPRGPPKKRKFPTGFPGDIEASSSDSLPIPLPGPKRRYKTTRQRVRWNCHSCDTLFQNGTETCESCGHERCKDCIRSG